MSTTPRNAAPTRTCVGCGQRDAQSSLVRLRRGSEASIVPVVGSRTGRSAYVHAQSPCVKGLLRSKVLGKSLRSTVTKEARIELVRILEEQLASEAFAAPAK